MDLKSIKGTSSYVCYVCMYAMNAMNALSLCYLFYCHPMRYEEGIKTAGFDLDELDEAGCGSDNNGEIRQHRGTATITQNVLGIHVRK
jgi:hypothetical protein